MEVNDFENETVWMGLELNVW